MKANIIVEIRFGMLKLSMILPKLKNTPYLICLYGTLT